MSSISSNFMFHRAISNAAFVALLLQLMVYNDGELVNGCPYYFRVLPPLTKIKSPGMDPCAIGSIVEVLVNSYGT